MTNGICDVPKCNEVTYMGWRPLTERMGRQICESHWNRHKDGDFDLYAAFSFKKPPPKAKRVKPVTRCDCGKEISDIRAYCVDCIANRKRQQKREYYHRKNQVEKVEPESVSSGLLCECGDERKKGHTYCLKCSDRHKRLAHNKRQQKYYKANKRQKRLTVNDAFVSKNP